MKIKTEIKKLATFGILTSLFTSAYVTFLGTGLQQGFFTDGFFLKWVSIMPKAYLVVLPFILLVGPFIRKFVDFLFRHQKE